MSDGLGHLSKRTRERAYMLAKNAKSLGLTLGAVRFSPDHDYMSYYLGNGQDYLIIFCTPQGYLLEVWKEEDGEVMANFFGVKNIRHFLRRAKKAGYQDLDILFEDIHDEDDD